jgi:tol-pal system protein YbgF
MRQVLMVLTLMLGTGFVQAGLFDDDEARRAILDLRQRIDQLKQDSEQKLANEEKRSTEDAKRASDDSAQLRRALIDLQNQLEVSRAEMAKLRGQNEQLAREVAEIQRNQKDAGQSIEERIRKLEPIRVNVDGRDFLADPAEKRDFESAMAVFRKGDFSAAQAAFSDFLIRYSASGYRPSVLFWLGNSQYATKDYKEAQSNFRMLVQQTPEHIRVPEAMLAIANCQLEMKDAKAARKTLEELVAKHPGTEAAAAAKERLARLK